MNISRILTELKAERERIEKAIEAIQALDKESVAPSAASKPGPKPGAPKKKRKLTAEGRKRIAEAARRRWAAVHKAAGAKSAGSKAKTA
jgi:hypothetical protein